MIADESMAKIFCDFSSQFGLRSSCESLNRILCAFSIDCIDEHKTVIKWAKLDPQQTPDNRFIVGSPAERTKHHLTPYLTKLISQLCCVDVLPHRPDDDFWRRKAYGKMRDAHTLGRYPEEEKRAITWSTLCRLDYIDGSHGPSIGRINCCVFTVSQQVMIEHILHLHRLNNVRCVVDALSIVCIMKRAPEW